MFRLKALVATSFLATQPALAADPNQTRFAANGEHFEYTTALSHGAVLIQGRVVESHEPFSLRVNKNGRVSGRFGSADVDFEVSHEASEHLFAQLKGDNLASAR